uniref:Outer membrane protein assembly factor BamC n=1 Tax=Hydrogenovibrio crunogenus (strain DSM 25203 / XCL-2) TaxID=317025 RepID=Q31FD0_HYDCU
MFLLIKKPAFNSRGSAIMAAAISFSFLVTGCSSTPSSQKNADSVLDYDADTSYRDTEKSLSKDLAVPPNLFLPSKKQDEFDIAISKASTLEEEYRYIPTYRADNLMVKSNLSERWLEIKGMSSEKVWQGVQSFLVSLGMPVKEARKDTGFIRTEFVPRKELVPLDDQGPLTKLLNSWRPELADGLYDRLIAQVEYDADKDVTRVYFHHYVVSDPSVADSEDAAVVVDSGWKVKPYNPLIEAEALYQAMIFFGASQGESLKAIQMTQNQVHSEQDDATNGLKVDASPAETWSYLKAMLYRSGWFYEHIKPVTKEVWVIVPESARKENSLGSKLAFWRSDDDAEKYIPKRIKFTVETLNEQTPDRSSGSLLKVETAEASEPLTREKRHYIFESLGLLKP